MNKTLPLLFLLPMLAIAAPAAADDDTGLYIGVGVNRLSADFEDENDVDFEDSDNAFSGKVGYMFNDFIGLELGYLDLGDYVAEGDSVNNRIDLNADARSAAIIGNWSVLDQMDLYGKLGLYNIDVESTSTIAGNVVTADNDENELFVAFGIEYDIGQINVFGEFSVADTDISELSINIISGGLKLEF